MAFFPTRTPMSVFPLLLGFTLLFTSCISVRPSGTRSGGKAFETFFIGEQGTQYFIKPLEFSHGKEVLQADFTFRYLDQMRDSVTVNVSLFRPVIQRQLDSLSLQAGQRSAVIPLPTLLFTEKQGKLFHSRFSGHMALKDLHALFMESPAWSITPWLAGKSDSYLPTRRSGKTIRSLKDDLFILF